MKILLISLLLLPLVCYGQSVGDLIFPKATATGSTELYVTPSATKLLGLDGSSNPTTVSLTGTGLTLTSNALGLAAADNWLLTLPIPAEDTITTEQVGMGWADGRFTLQTPVGAFQLYETGSPLQPTLYWPGRLQIDEIEANLVTANFTGGQITSGTIPPLVMQTSTSKPMRQWQDHASYAGANGLTYGTTGPAGNVEPSNPGRYFPVIDVVDDNSTGNYLDGEIRTAAQLRADLDLETGTDLLGYVAPGTSGNVLTSNGTSWVSSAPAASGVALGDSPTWTGTHTFSAGNVIVHDKLSLKTTGEPTDATAVEVIADPANPSVRALRLLPPANGTRIYVGRSGQAAYALNLQYCTTLEWCPPISVTANGITVGSAFATSISRSADGTQIGANHPSDGGLTVYHDASYASIAASQLVARIHRISGISFYGTNTSATSYERVSLSYDSGASTYYIDTQNGAAGGSTRPIEIRTGGTARIKVTATGGIIFAGLPTADPGVSGQLWNDGGTLKISP